MLTDAELAAARSIVTRRYRAGSRFQARDVFPRGVPAGFHSLVASGLVRPEGDGYQATEQLLDAYRRWVLAQARGAV